MLQILPALLRAPLVAGLVLGGDQRVRAAPPFGREVKIACCGPNVSLDMAPPALDRLQAPLRLMGIDQERGVIIWAIVGPQAGGAIVAAAMLQTRPVKSIHRRARSGRERQVTTGACAAQMDTAGKQASKHTRAMRARGMRRMGRTSKKIVPCSCRDLVKYLGPSGFGN